MVRTETVELTTIPAIAYRQKLPAGGAGIVILRAGASQPGIASISKTSGEPIPADNTPSRLYPKKAFREAIELTNGLPYNKRSNPEAPAAQPKKTKKEKKIAGQMKKVEEAGKEAGRTLEPGTREYRKLAESKEYEAVLAQYTDKNGAFSYDLLNKDLIKFAHSSSKVREMIAKKEPAAKIRAYIVGTKFRSITGNKDLTDETAAKLAELLDEKEPKGVFKELNEEIRRGLRKK